MEGEPVGTPVTRLVFLTVFAIMMLMLLMVTWLVIFITIVNSWHPYHQTRFVLVIILISHFSLALSPPNGGNQGGGVTLSLSLYDSYPYPYFTLFLVFLSLSSCNDGNQRGVTRWQCRIVPHSSSLSTLKKATHLSPHLHYPYPVLLSFPPKFHHSFPLS